jgi:hypothetical protein
VVPSPKNHHMLVGLSSLEHQESRGHASHEVTRYGRTSAHIIHRSGVAYTVEYAYNMQHHCSNAGHATPATPTAATSVRRRFGRDQTDFGTT